MLLSSLKLNQDQIRFITHKLTHEQTTNIYKLTNMGYLEVLAVLGSSILLALTFPVSMFWCFKVVKEFERAVIFRLGKLKSGVAEEPGIFFILPCVDTFMKIDLRTTSLDIPPQEALTKDSVTVNVNAIIYYKIEDPLLSVSKVENYSHSTQLLAMTTLRKILGTKNLAEVLADRETISSTMQMSLNAATTPWGIEIERVEIKDVTLPSQLQRAMAAEAEAAADAKAKIVAAEGEMKAARALKEAADVINESPSALQLRYLQTLNNIAGEKSSTIVFPLPIDFLSHFIKMHVNMTKNEKKNL